MSVVIETTIGDITVDLFTEERPVACQNFIKLCKLKYYNYNLFHTVEQGFIAQTGDPTGAGDGGCSVWGVVEGLTKRFFEAESVPKIYHSSAGLLSLVSAGKSMVGSQFFFTLGSKLTSLDGVHCVIGEVVEGHETLRKLNESIVDEHFRPYQDIRITHTVILDDPYPDPRGFRVPSRSPSPSPGRLQNGRIAADEEIDDTDGKTMEEVQEMLAEREAKARATILEIVGDLPDAEMAPPENVLFVCKLNPVTTDDDMEIIFSRFGKVKSCEVIRDKKTNDSLQYAFIEFEEQKACEAAYFKMDNVLIDDRRIHVDFSQSVAKIKWRGKGRGVEGADDGRLDFNNLRDDGGRRDRVERVRRNDNPNPSRDTRGRLNSEERRKAREQRHRELEAKELNEKRRLSSPSQSRKRDERKGDERRRGKSPIRRRPDNEDSRDRRRGEMPARRRPSRSRSRELARRRSPSRSKELVRRRSAERSNRRVRQSPERRRPNDDRERRREASPARRLSAKKEEPHRRERADKIKNPFKKRKHQSSSSEDSHTSDSESSSDSSTDSSSSDSSSEEDRRRKKKSIKLRKSKTLKSKKKHKK